MVLYKRNQLFYLLTRLPAVSAISGLVSYTSDKLLSTNYADSRHVGCCGSYYSDFYHLFFFIRLVHCLYHRLTGGAALAVELEKGELETFTGFNPWFPINALVEEAIICIKDPYQITSALLHL